MKKEQAVSSGSSWLLPAALSMTAGAVDVIGFLALGGLFTAHITGNLVILLAHYITGNFGQIGPLLAVPIFIVVLGVVTWTFIRKPTSIARRELLVLQVVLLACFLGFGAGFGAFPNPDSGMAVFVGMLGVAAMATQYGNRYCNDHDRQGLGIVAAPTFGQTRLDCCISGAEQISKLISKTRERDPSIRRREFIQMSWNYTPGALDQELHRESPGCQPEWTGRERPQGNDRQSQQCLQ